MDDDRSVLGRISETGLEPPQVRLKRLAGEPELPVGPVARDGPKYEILGEIGRGGVGIVFRSLDVDLGRDVAMKILREEHAGNVEIARRFVEEAKIEGRLQHPGIVPVYDLGYQADRRPFFTMKLVRGEALSSILKAREDVSADRRRVLSIFEQVCQTMAYAHSRGVIHRDLKPGNVLTGEFGEVQVVDWGFAKVMWREDREEGEEIAGEAPVRIARVRDGSSTGSVAGEVMGTPAYMPPEQAQGRIGELDERCDVFALGAILCEILTGEPPYVKASGDVMTQAAEGAVDGALRRLAACDADEALAAMARQCLAPDLADRPRDASALARALSEHLVSLEQRAHRAELRVIEERAEAARARTRADEARAVIEEQRRRRRETVSLTSAILLVLLAAGAGWRWVAESRADRARRATTAVDEVMREAARLRGAEDFEGALAASLRARDLAGEDGVDPETRREAEATVGIVEAELAAQRKRNGRQAEDDAVTGALIEVRVAPPGEMDPVARDDGYAKAFRDFGIDVEALGPEQAAERIRARAIAEELASALDAWAALRRSEEALAKRDAEFPDTVARLADPDEGRNEIRDLAAGGDLDAIRERAKDADVMAVPARTLALLAFHLLDGNDPAAAVDLLKRAAIEHPDDLWIDVQLADAYERLETPDVGTALRFHFASVALRPQSAGLRERLGRAQLRGGSLEGAAATWRVLGEMLLERGLVERAVRALHESEAANAKRGTEDPRNWCLLAKCHATMGENDRATEFLGKVTAWKDGRDSVSEELLTLEREARALLGAD